MRTRAMRRVARAIVGIGAMLSTTSVASQVTNDSIKTNMALLQSLVGNWSFVATFHQRDGAVAFDDGTYRVKPILDGSYLQIDATLFPRAHPDKAHSFMELITFNPESKKFDITYFYSRSALRVSAQGEFDAAKHDFNYAAYIPREDGIRNENVRAVMQMLNREHLRYIHFSRYDDEAKETMDLQMDLTRTK